MLNKLCHSLIPVIFLSVMFVGVQAEDWCDDFESYLIGSSAAPNWHGSGNTSGIQVDTSTYVSGAKSLKLYGEIGGCWGAMVTRNLEVTYPFTIELKVKNRTESLYGCHPYHASFGFKMGPDLWDDGVPGGFVFTDNGDFWPRVAGPDTTVSGFTLNEWHTVKGEYTTPGDGQLHVKYWVNGQFIGEYTTAEPSQPPLYISIAAEEGTVWFDDICVSKMSIDSTNSLLFPSITVSPCDNECIAQPVMVDLSQPITGATISVKIPANVELCDISTDGLITEDWIMETYINPDDSSERAIGLWNLNDDMIPAGTTTVLNISFMTDRECETSKFIYWDTAFMGDPLHELLFSDSTNFDLQAQFNAHSDSTEIAGYEPGNVDNIVGPVSPYDIADLSCMVGHIYMGDTTCLCVLDAADVNGSCTGPNIADITYLVASLYKGGPDPVCGCLGQGGAYKVSTDIFVSTSYENGVTTVTLSSPVDLRGLQVTLTGDGVPAPVSLADAQLELLSGSHTIGLVDLQGEVAIKSGTRRVVEVPGKYEIAEAIAADMNHHDVMLSVSSGKQGTIPDSYSLSQNYPNPFNPTTEIQFSLPNAGDVYLEIYNVMGQRVRTLVAEHLDAGVHTVTWDSKSDNGDRVASGVYFYRLTTDEFVGTKKMILLK